MTEPIRKTFDVSANSEELQLIEVLIAVFHQVKESEKWNPGATERTLDYINSRFRDKK